MGKINILRGFLCALMLSFFASLPSAHGSVLITQRGSIARGLASIMNEYAAKHNGEAPRSWDDLKPFLDFEQTEITLRAPIQSKMLLFADRLPTLEDEEYNRVVAMTAFPIDEDRRGEIGRYVVVYQQKTGKFDVRWKSEQTLQKAAAAASVYVPPAAVYQERLLEPLAFGYGARLIEDAVSHGVPLKEAEAVVEKHVDDVSNRRAKPATTWAEITAATPAAPSPVQSPTLTASPQPTSPNAQAPAAPFEQPSPVWPWVLGIATLTVIALLIWKRRV